MLSLHIESTDCMIPAPTVYTFVKFSFLLASKAYTFFMPVFLLLGNNYVDRNYICATYSLEINSFYSLLLCSSILRPIHQQWIMNIVLATKLAPDPPLENLVLRLR